ncbi:small conductance calcium-activated potassium channel protein 2-like isoform X2 [Liolophura sinensis]
MSGNTMIEDPGIPLVDRRNGKYSKYVEDDTFSQSSASTDLTPVSKYDNISYRLSQRKKYLFRRRVIVDVEFAMAMLGIILMIIDNELFIRDVYTKDSVVSVLIKVCISISTVLLLGLVCMYHVCGIKLFMTDNALEDWRLAVGPATIVKISLELVVCAIHPIPGNFTTTYYPASGEPREVPIDAILSILMMLRLYLVGKFMVMHSRMLTDTSTQSLGALNKVKIDATFVFKALMSTNPGTMLIAIMLLVFLVNSWAMRTCEVYYDPDQEHSSFRDALWLIVITFLTVGYGDIYPKSDCGRMISFGTGILGVGTTALLVAVLGQKLEQTRLEKYVHNFASRVQLDKQRKHAASDVIKNVIYLWKLRRRGGSSNKTRVHRHGKLLQAIQTMREAKSEKSIINESAIGPVEIHKAVNDVFDVVEDFSKEQNDLKERVSSLEGKLDGVDSKLDAIYAVVSRRH